jgi:Zn-dependent peptidase ImmA (M78 family)
MSTSTVDIPGQANETKVCPRFGTALEVSAVEEARIKKEAAEDAAQLLKATFRLRMPVDPIAIAQELGIRVREGELDRDRLGGLVIEPGEEPQIYMNELDLLVRRRLTCAIELGHYIRGAGKSDKYGRVDRRSDRIDAQQDPESIYAEEFAACLLVPDGDARLMVELGLDELEMALRFRVSMELLQLRLNELGLHAAQVAKA